MEETEQLPAQGLPPSIPPAVAATPATPDGADYDPQDEIATSVMNAPATPELAADDEIPTTLMATDAAAFAASPGVASPGAPAPTAPARAPLPAIQPTQVMPAQVMPAQGAPVQAAPLPAAPAPLAPVQVAPVQVAPVQVPQAQMAPGAYAPQVPLGAQTRIAAEAAAGHPKLTGRRRQFSLALIALFTLVCAGALYQTYEILIRTAHGQRLDQIAMLGGGLGRSFSETEMSAILNVVSVSMVAFAIGAVALIAIVRRRLWVAISAATLIAGANVTTQLLKKVILERPNLGATSPLTGSAEAALNTFPSGHTTVAASVALALVMVVGPKLRPLTAVLGIGYAAATGIATMVMGWHRPSDVIGGVLVCGVWAGLLMLVAGIFRGRTSGSTGSIKGAVSVLVVAGLLLAAAGALIMYQVGLTIPSGLISKHTDFSRTNAALAFASSVMVVCGTTAAVFGSVMGLVSGSRHR